VLWDNMAYCVELSGEDMSRYVNKTEHERQETHTHIQTFYDPFSGTTRVSQCQKRTSGLYGARGSEVK